MTSGQGKALFNTIDNDKNGDVSDDEWNEFYATFYTPFVACDADKDNFLSSASEMLTCLTKTDIANT